MKFTLVTSAGSVPLPRSFTIYRDDAGFMGEQLMGEPMRESICDGYATVTDDRGLVTLAALAPVESSHEPPAGVHKAVLQFPIEWDDGLKELEWEESAERHGPHLRFFASTDPETGLPCVMARCKHRSSFELLRLVTKATDAMLEFGLSE